MKKIEIIGVAGSGKSTLARALCGDNTAHHLDEPLELRNAEHLRFALPGLGRSAAMIGRSILHRRPPTWTELKLLAYLSEWPRRLEAEAVAPRETIFMDQGPVYALARLGRRPQPIPGTEPHSPWWESTVSVWAGVLDMIIWTDAPDDVLLERINAREQGHEIKGADEQTGASYIGRYRESYATVVGSIEGSGGPTVVRYDTSLLSPQELVSDTIAHLTRAGPGPNSRHGGLS